MGGMAALLIVGVQVFVILITLLPLKKIPTFNPEMLLEVLCD